MSSPLVAYKDEVIYGVSLIKHKQLTDIQHMMHRMRLHAETPGFYSSLLREDLLYRQSLIDALPMAHEHSLSLIHI